MDQKQSRDALVRDLEQLVSDHDKWRQEAIAREHAYLVENEAERKRFAETYGDPRFEQIFDDANKKTHIRIALIQQDSDAIAIVREFLRQHHAGTMTVEKAQEMADMIALLDFGFLSLTSK